MREILAAEVSDVFERAVAALEDCPGKIITTGMGKAGFIARKFAAVLCSTGTPAVFIEAAEAAHGDLGLTPTASMAVMAAIGDVLALVLMERKGITRHDYGLRHHGGYLGRKARGDNE